MEKSRTLNNMFVYLLSIIREDEKQEVKSIEFIIESMANLSKEIEAENQRMYEDIIKVIKEFLE